MAGIAGGMNITGDDFERRSPARSVISRCADGPGLGKGSASVDCSFAGSEDGAGVKGADPEGKIAGADCRGFLERAALGAGGGATE